MLVYAHRGASGEFPENTAQAIEQAIAQQADGIELDVQFHRDGNWWLLHNLYVDKTTQGSGRLLALSSDYIQSLTTADGKPLLTLPQVLNIINNRCPVNIEVKISTGEGQKLKQASHSLISLIDELVDAGKANWQNLVISSFNHLFLAELKREKAAIKTGALIAHCPADLAQSAQQLQANSINLALDCLNQQIVDDAHRRKLQVWVYTVDRQDDIAFCHQLGIEAIFSNFPARTKHYLAEIANK
ncbi:glycerophosphodiester phosphodiesterase [Colwellia sp. MEBiC06753]